MKNLKRFVAYFLYVVLVGCSIVWANAYEIALKNDLSRGFELFIIWASLPTFIGLILALPRFIVTIQKPGIWTFDWVKFIAVGLPSFLAAGATSIFWVISFWVISFLHQYMPFLFNNSILTTTGGIVFGYVLLTAFKKKSPNSLTLSEADDGVPLQ